MNAQEFTKQVSKDYEPLVLEGVLDTRSDLSGGFVIEIETADTIPMRLLKAIGVEEGISKKNADAIVQDIESMAEDKPVTVEKVADDDFSIQLKVTD